MTRGPAKLVFKRIPDMSEKRKEKKNYLQEVLVGPSQYTQKKIKTEGPDKCFGSIFIESGSGQKSESGSKNFLAIA